MTGATMIGKMPGSYQINTQLGCCVAMKFLPLLVAILLSPATTAASSCESLTSISLPYTTVASAQMVAAGNFIPQGIPGATPAALDAEQAFKTLPAFCRVAATIKPTADSDIKIEVWMPASGWNGKFQGVGGGGFAGVISYGALGDALKAGYATASTDTGHSGWITTASWALGHPEVLIDFAYRSVHETTVKAKQIVEVYYGAKPKRAYFVGCSRGGYQGLVEAARYPDDYNGIVAGASGVFPAQYMADQLWVAGATLKNPDSYIPPAKYETIHRAMLAACDARDGVKDGLLEDPRRCDFDPGILACKGPDSNDCLTSPQVTAARMIYAPPRNPRTGEALAPPLERGTELAWGGLAGGPVPSQLATEFFKYLVFEDPNWDWKTFDFDRDIKRTEAKVGTVMATSPDLSAFAKLGGKLILYHGWADQRIAPGNSIEYRDGVVRLLGETRSKTFLRLYMAPDMNHCGGGDGPNSFDMLSALDQWIEHGKVPDQIIASHSTNGRVDRTRPLCPYPKIAKYKGSGSTDDAANFECSRPD
jgi:feruloyl esterase